jgi:hypothetical protein
MRTSRTCYSTVLSQLCIRYVAIRSGRKPGDQSRGWWYLLFSGVGHLRSDPRICLRVDAWVPAAQVLVAVDRSKRQTRRYKHNPLTVSLHKTDQNSQFINTAFATLHNGLCTTIKIL